MIDSLDFSFFLISSIVLILAPGPDVLFLIAQSLQNGLRAGLAIALGLASGNLVHTLAAALGVTLALQTNQHALTVIQYLGAAYLLYLAYQALSATRTKESKKISFSKQHVSYFMRGVLMNILNPKVGIFFLAFLPQFIPAGTDQAHLVMMTLGLVFTLLVMIIFGSIAVLTHHFKQRSVLHTINYQFFNYLSAFVFIAIALHLLMAKF